MNREQAKAKYLELRSAGFSHEEAADALRSGSTEDPTAQYWDALIQQESGGRQSAVSPKGATGIAQVMEATGPEAAELAGRNWDPVAWRNDPEYNAAIGRAYLRAQMRRFGNPELGLAAYNAGPGRVQQMLDQGRSLPQETQNYVPAITGNSEKPMLSRDQARQYVQQRMSEGADMATIKAELQQQMGGQAPAPAPAAPQTAPATMAQAQAPAPQVAPPQPAPAPAAATGASGSWGQQPQGQDLGDQYQAMLEETWPYMSDNPGSRGIHAFNRGAADILRGGRQLYNQLTGDEDTLRMLQEQEARSRQFEQKINPSGSGLNIQDVAKAAPAMMAFGTGTSAPAMIGMGGLQGAMQPTVEGESRGFNTAVGVGMGTLGAGISKAGDIYSAVKDRFKNAVSTKEGLQSLSKALGSEPGDEILGTYASAGKKITDKLRGLEDDFAKAYTKVEADPSLPPVKLLPAGKAGDEFELSDDVAKILTPRSQALLKRISSKGEKASVILDKAGNPIKVDEKVPFEDVRTAIREIRSAARNFERGDISRLQLKRAENMLADDLLVWSGRGEKAGEAYRAAKALDAKYRQEVVPFYSNKTAVGKYLKSETLDEKAFNNAFIGDETGMAAKDISKRVPEIRDDIRRLYGAKLREAKGPTPTIRKLESGTTGEALLSKPEREYLLKVAKTIGEEAGPGQHSNITGTGILRALEKVYGGSTIQRMQSNLRPYGAGPVVEGLSKGKKSMINYLRTGGVEAALGE